MTPRLGMHETLPRNTARAGLDAYLLTDKYELRYLLGDECPGGLLLVPATGRPALFAGSMVSLFSDLDRYPGGVELLSIGRGVIADIAEYCFLKNFNKVGVSPKARSGFLESLNSVDTPVRFVCGQSAAKVDDSINEARKLKTPEEITVMRRLAAETAEIARSLESDIRPGMTDWQIVSVLDGKVRESGAFHSFDTIAAVDRDSADPHAKPNGRKFKADSHIVLDFGIKKSGYCSDLTRTICTGRINRRIAAFYDTVRKTQDFIIENIKPGGSISELVKRALGVIENDGFADQLLHGFGHGIGLEVHEPPSIGAAEVDIFIEGMVLTVEPGLYQKGVGGVRVEDMVLVEFKGCEVLTR